MDMTPDALVTLAGVILSLVFAYLPGAKDWFDGLDRQYKPLFMAGVLLVVAAGKLLYDCQLQPACLELNWSTALWTWLIALVANQTTFAVGVKQIKAAE